MSTSKKRHRRFWWFVKIQIALMVLVGLLVGYYYLGGYAKVIQSLRAEAVSCVTDSSAETFRNNETSVCYDANGKIISTLVGERDVYYVFFEDIPARVLSAMVSTEDKKFYRHHGYDFRGIARAAWAAMREQSITQGGSTITQQLARNMYLTQDRTWERKVEEIFIAVELEKKYSKNEILEFYLNNIYFGNGYYGIAAAAKGYFSSSLKELSLSQVAFLCGIPNSPVLYDPLTNYENTLERRNVVLGEMLEDGVISQKDYDEAVTEVIELKQTSRNTNDYLESFTYDCAVRALMAANGFEFRNEFNSEEDRYNYEELYSEVYGEYQRNLYTGGYRIYTSLDLEMQEKLQQAVNEQLGAIDNEMEDGIYKLQGAAVCIDNRTGLVKAIVGGRNPADYGYTLNRAYQSFRQPGSAIKPLIVYTPELERGYTPDSIVVDEEVAVDENDPAAGVVHNADNYYAGEMTLRRAVSISKNTVAWKMFRELTPEVGLNYLLEMGFSNIVRDDYRLPSALGGLTEGVSVLEMTSAYSAMENDGAFREPSAVVRITDSVGNIIYKENSEEKQIYKENAARMMTEMLESVIQEGTGRGYGIDNMECAAKTGTTNDNKDGWFVGYTHYYTTGVWVGYDMPRSMPGLTKTSYPGLIWQQFMEEIHSGLVPVSLGNTIAFDDKDAGIEDEQEETSQPEDAEMAYEEEAESTERSDGQDADAGTYESEAGEDDKPISQSQSTNEIEEQEENQKNDNQEVIDENGAALPGGILATEQ